MHVARSAGLTPVLLATLAALPTPTRIAAQDKVYTLEGLVVTASPLPRAADAVAQHVTVLEADALRAEGIVSVADALRAVPGLQVVRGGSFGANTSLFMRGGESDYVQVLVDGVRVNQPGGAFDLSGLTLDNVERIEIVRGPASALYGSGAMTGVVQIITRTGDGPLRGSATVRGGSFGRTDVSAEISGGGAAAVGYGFSLARHRTDGILPFNNAFRNTVLSGAVRLRPDAATRARISVRLSDRAFHFPTDGSGNVVDTNAFTYADEAVLGLDVTRRVAPSVGLRALVTMHGFDGGTDDRPDGPGDTLGFYGFTSLDSGQRAAADLRVDLHAGATTVVSIGGNVEEERQRSFNESLSQFGPSTGRSDNRRWNRAGYVHAVTGRGPVAANAGLRVEDNERFGGFVTYQAGVSVALRPGTRIRASAGRGVKEPTFFENFASGFVRGNPDLKPERSRSWEVGLDQRALDGRLGLRATYFSQRFRDLVQFTFSPPQPSDPNYFNVAKADARGLELSADARVAALTLDAGYTYLSTEVVDAGFDEGPDAAFVAGAPMLRRPRHAWSLSAGYRAGARLRLDASLRFTGRRDDRDFSTFPATRATLDSYTLMDAGGQVTLWAAAPGRPGLDVLVRAENLLDERYQEVFGFPAPGRGIYIAGRMTFSPR